MCKVTVENVALALSGRVSEGDEIQCYFLRMKTIHALAQESAHRVEAKLGNENNALVEFLLELAEFDEKQFYLPLGYDSTWSFLRQGLGQSEAMTAAEVIQGTNAIA